MSRLAGYTPTATDRNRGKLLSKSSKIWSYARRFLPRFVRSSADANGGLVVRTFIIGYAFAIIVVCASIRRCNRFVSGYQRVFVIFLRRYVAADSQIVFAFDPKKKITDSVFWPTRLIGNNTIDKL